MPGPELDPNKTSAVKTTETPNSNCHRFDDSRRRVRCRWTSSPGRVAFSSFSRRNREFRVEKFPWYRRRYAGRGTSVSGRWRPAETERRVTDIHKYVSPIAMFALSVGIARRSRTAPATDDTVLEFRSFRRRLMRAQARLETFHRVRAPRG